ncbi:non-ribosomal peptide synthetase [Teredinibacter turnerae]|uniref:non-ribosomal peptide synthetase n=1 Tax=Teredinibacter turnerae TaxID=2426 RepID=UPI0005F834D2|nr:non-ribosomal peptide synthetase [Teredinibacter turnerae]
MSEITSPAETIESLLSTIASDNAVCPLQDALASGDANSTKCTVEVTGISGLSTSVCLTTWHMVLNWLQYDKHPVVSLVMAGDDTDVLPLLSQFDDEGCFSEYHAFIAHQLDTPSLYQPLESLAEEMRCLHEKHCVVLAGCNTRVECDFLIRQTTDGWIIEANGSRFTLAYVKAIAAFWQDIIRLSHKSAELKISQIDFPAETTLPVGLVRGETTSISGDLVTRFYQCCTEYGNSLAVIDVDGAYTYIDLDQRSSQIALLLQEMGVGAGDNVALAFPRSKQMVAAQYAVLKLGAVFIPLDYTLPRDRISSMNRDASFKCVLSCDTILPEVAEKVVDVPVYSLSALKKYRPDEFKYAGRVQSMDPAYIIFTSGSTGLPKGVRCTHANLLNFILHFERENYLPGNGVSPQFAPFSFDASVAEIHTSILNGNTLLVLSKELINSPEDLQVYMTENACTFAVFPPQYLQHLDPAKLPTLERLATAGSAPNHDILSKWMPHVSYMNAYGPTETTVLSTVWEGDEIPAANAPITMGKPISNTLVKIVNQYGRAVPIGVTGELVIGGAGVAEGYVNREELTAEKFYTDEHGRWYKSGDLAAFDVDKHLIFKGRIDDQIKLRGHRLEPGEIEAAVHAIDYVNGAAVVVHKTGQGLQLVLFLTGEEQAEDKVRKDIVRYIPKWAMPNRIIWKTSFPLTVNGKINYKLLRAEVASISGVDSVSVEYANDLENSVAGIWRNVLQRPCIARDDNFLHLGGDSLTALVVVSSLRNLGFNISSSLLIQFPVFSEFVAAVAARGKNISRTYEQETGSAPLTPIQSWFFAQNLENTRGFCQSLVFDSTEVIDAERMHGALVKLVDYHDALRIAFQKGKDEKAWSQTSLGDVSHLISIKELAVDESEIESRTTEQQITLTEDLDIRKGPLFRMAVLQSGLRSRVLFVLHHLVMDTISHAVLLNDLYELYTAPERDVKNVLPGKSLSYFSWARKSYSNLQSSGHESLRYWEPMINTAKNAEKLPLPVRASYSLDVVDCVFDKSLTAQLLEIAPTCYRQSPEELLMAAVYLATAEAFNMRTVGLALEWHGRDEEFAGEQGLDRTVGWFTSIHPLYLTVPDSTSLDTKALGDFLCLLKDTRAEVPNRGRDFYGLQYQLNTPDSQALFDGYTGPEIMFNFSGVAQGTNAPWQPVPITAIEMGEGNQNPYRLSVESQIRDSELVMALYVDKNIWKAQQIEQFKNALSRNLSKIIAHCCSDSQRRWTRSDFPGLPLTNEQISNLPSTLLHALPLTAMQETLHRHKDIYQVWMHYRFPHRFDKAVFDAAVARWVAHSECLRTVIKQWDTECVGQLVLADVSPQVQVIRVNEDERTAAVDAFIAQDREQQVEFTDLPPYSVTVFDDGSDSFSLVLSIHHIIHDGWTIELLMESLDAFYQAASGIDVALPAAPVAGMREIVDEQARISRSEKWNNYWDSVSWSENYCKLPVASSSAQTATGDVSLLLRDLSNDASSKARAAAQQLGVTPNSFFLTAFTGLLRYIGGGHQVRCGVIQSGRPDTVIGVDQITGCCVNTLPLVIDFSKDESIASISARVQQQLLALKESAAYPLSKIYQSAKNAVNGELFECLFNIESSDYGSSSASIKPTLVGGYESTNYSFIFGLIEKTTKDGDKTFGLRLGYDTAKYSQAQIEQWVEIYQTLLLELADNVERHWADVNPLPQTDRDALVSWNNTAVDYPAEVLLGEHFERAASANPEKVALAFKDQRVTYAQLEEQSARLARVLQSKGAGPETVVGLVAERSLEMVYGILAVIRAGAAYVPIDPKYPEDRVTHMLDELGCKLVLLQKPEYADVVPSAIKAECLPVWETMELATDTLPELDRSNHQTRQLAYVMYTSGSTGKPKGVMIEQRSIVRLVKNAQDVKFAPSDCILITSAPGFDVTTYELWSALLNGLTLAVIDEDTLLNPEALAHEIREKSVSFLWVVAPLFNQLVQEKPDLFAPVKRIMIGGDALSPYHINLARLHSPGLEFINGYGPTENTSFSTYHFLSEADSEIIPIGRPITNSTCYVLNPDGQPLPVGVKGELCVGGHGVARGYYNRPDLTQERFFVNPFISEDDVLYRTGDLVSWRSNGLIDFHGRIDFQIKIRGFRVELGEIETVILQVAAVKQAIVLAKDYGNQKRLVAYIVQDTEADNRAEEAFVEDLKHKLAAELTDYMVPEHIVVLTGMPLNANGKIDRARLPEPDYSQSTSAVETPTNDIEAALWKIWKDVLKTESFGVTDNFYTIGGDSIVAIQVVSRAVKQNLRISTRSLFEHKTIRELAAYLNTESGGEVTAVAPRDQEPVKGEQRLLPIHLQFLYGDTTDLHHYNQAAKIALPADVSIEQLQSILQALVIRHDAFRLRFRQAPAGWVGRYNTELLDDSSRANCWIRELDLRFAAEPEKSNSLCEALKDAQTSLDLKAGDLCRWLWVREDETSTLYWVMHHLIVDGVSWRVLQADFELALEQLRSGSAALLPAKATSYQAWAGQLYEVADAEWVQNQKDYWLQQLNAPTANLPYDRASNGDMEQATNIVEVSWSTYETSQLLNQANKCYQTQINDLLVAAFMRALHTWANIDALRIDMEGHGREHLFEDTDLSQTVGWFTTLFPLAINLPRADIGQQILAIKAQLDSLPNKGIGFGLLSQLCQDEDIIDLLDVQPLAPVVFNYLGQMDAVASDTVSGLAFEMSTEGGTTSSNRRRLHALGFNGYVKNGQLIFNVDYSSGQFDRETIERLSTAFQTSLKDIIEHCVGGDDDPKPRFDLATVSKDQLQQLEAHYPSLSDIYPITAMQQGLVLYTQRDQSGAYITQMRMVLESPDKARLRKTWEILVSRYDILRTCFVDLGQQQLSQVVSSQVALPWRDCVFNGTDAELEQLLHEERVAALDVAQAPLMRLLLVEQEEQSLLAWTHHHALMDGWSMSVLIQDMLATYVALAEGDVPPKTVPAYKDYVRWLNSQDAFAAEAFWKKQMAGIDAADNLPQAKRDLSAEGEQRVCVQEMDAELTAQLQTLSRQSGVTLSAFIQNAWALLLSKYTGEQDIVFGYAISGRPPELDGVESMVGLFINSLPMRLSIGLEDSLAQALQNIQQIQMEQDEYHFVSLGDIQQWAGLRGDLRLFESLVVLENYPLDPAALNSSNPHALRIHDIQGIEQNDFALNLVVYPGERLTVKLVYQSGIYTEAVAAAMLQHFCTLLSGSIVDSVAALDSTGLKDLPLLSSEQEKWAVFDCNHTEYPLPEGQSIYQLVQDCLLDRANEIVLVMDNEHLTGDELDARVDVFSRWLQNEGVVSGDRVAISLPKSPDMLACILAIIKLGAAYVPVALDCPRDRLLFICGDAAIRTLVGRSSERERFSDLPFSPVFTDEINVHARPQEQRSPAAEVEDLATQQAYVIYTSGTTGQPKGVAISHLNLINFAFWCKRDGIICEGDVVSQFAPFTFDASVGECFGALVCRAELHLLSDELIQSPQAVAEYMAKHNVGFGAFPPPYVQQMDINLLPKTLKLLTAGSAPAIEKVREWGEHCRYINAYGPTETTVLSSAWWYDAATAGKGKLPIGRPIANTQMYVLDQYGQLCPPGITGEIVIGGAGVAVGYLNRDDLTRASFTADPWRNGNRVYHTGDLGHWLADGTIEFAGRRDHQVKIRGFRIELGGVEYQLRQQAEVDKVAVLAKTIGADNQLLAWVVPTDAGRQQDPIELVAKLRDALREKLAHYMVPQGFMIVDDLPVTANGKIDSKALLAQEIDPIYEGGYIAPESELELALTKIWAELLHIDPEKLSVTANFFDIGGHSLLATRVVTEIASRLGVKVAIRDIFDKGNITGLASLIETGGIDAIETIPLANRELQLPPSFSQQRLWFIDKLENGSAQYNQPLFLRIDGVLDQAALQKALDAIVERHEVLRTVFVAEQGEPQLKVLPASSLNINIIDFTHLRSDEAEAELHHTLETEVGSCFDLENELMLRATCVHVQPERSVLALTLHHIASDGWSFSVITNEFVALYEAFINDEPALLPSLPVQYTDYASWQRESLSGDNLNALVSYWENQLEDLPQVHKLPLDFPRPAEQSYRGGMHLQVMGPELTQAMRRFTQDQKCTLFMFLQACFSAVLARYSHDDDIVVGTPIANREQPGLESLIGFFVNTLVLRNKVNPELSFEQLLEQCKETALQAYAHQQMPFDLLVEELQPERSLSYNPLFQVMLALENIDNRREIAIPGARLSAMDNPFQAMAQFDLSVDIEEGVDTLTAVWSFAADLFHESTIARMAKHFERFIVNAIAAPQAPLHSITVMDEPEITDLLRNFNHPVVPELISASWPALFAAQVEKNPQKIVAECEGKTLTLAELEASSARIARVLMCNNLGRDNIVALLDHRGLDLLTMIVGVLRAGAAYLPLDPTQPEKRWLEILEDSRPDVLLVGDSLTESANQLRASWEADQIAQLHEVYGMDADDRALPEVSLDDLSYVLFTSGSTGKPKGVMVEHRGMINNMLSKVEPLGLTENDVIAQTASQCFDISVWQFLTAPILGAKVVIFTNETTRDPQALVNFLEQCQVTIWEPVPSVIQAILPLDKSLPSMRWVLPTGEALKSALVDRWFEKYPEIPLLNLYGPAECSDDVSLQPMYSPVDRVLIGTPVANARLHIVDNFLNLLPVGVVGELAVSGPVVGRGYLHRPDLTDKAFRVNPYPQDDMDARLYLTGDLAKRHADGSLEFIGRKDNQVKVRGFRIELGEIESRLVQLPDVKEAVVRVVEVAEQDKRLVGYVVKQPSSEANIDQIREAIRAQLPEYMVPSWLIELQAIPLTPNGKVDNKALPQPDANSLSTAEYVAPVGSVETILAETWQSLLNVERVGRKDNFFNLGGHSLLVMKLIEALRAHNLNMDVRRVFDAEDLADLARHIQSDEVQETYVPPQNLIPAGCNQVLPAMLPLVALSQTQIDQIAAQVPGGHSNIQDIYPLTPLQEGILFDHLVSDVGDTYLASVLVGFETRAVLDRYLDAMQQLVNRHDSLRSAIIWENLPRSVQVVYRDAPLKINEITLDTDRDAVAQFEEMMSLEGRHIDLTRAPVVGLTIAQDEKTGLWIVLQQQHHLMCDQVSMEIEFQDIMALMEGRGAELKPPVPYREFVAHSMYRAEKYDATAYFTQLLAGIDEPTAPFGLMDVYRGDKQTEELIRTLDSKTAQLIRDVSNRLAASPAAIFHLAWGLVLARCCNRDDVVFGTVTSGRLQGASGSDRTFGLFINMLPMRLKLAGLSVAQAMQLTRDSLVELLNYEQAPLVDAQRCADLPGSTPLFSAVLNYRHEGGEKLDLQQALEGVSILSSPGDISNYLFDMSISDQGHTFELTASIDRDIGAERIMAYMSRALEQVSLALINEPESHLLTLPVLTDDEQTQLLSEFNAPLQRQLFSKTWLQLFHEQVAQSADKVVAICDDRSLTFAELEAHTGVLARALQAKGLGRGSIIGLLDHRGIDLLIMIIGVLRAGAAYLPLDPTQPTKRWLEILQDSKPNLLITGNGFAIESRWLKRKWAKDSIVTLDEACVGGENADVTLSDVALDDLAYVIFTSGSTGKPKGVMIEHLGMVNNMMSKVEPLGLSAGDVIAQTASQCFDISVWQFLTAPILGATVVIVTNETTKDPQALVSCLADNHVTVWEPVPSVMQALLPLAHPLPDLRWVLPTGEALVSGLVERWFKQYPAVPLMNAYGPAECSDDVSFQPIHGPVERVFIGKPVANARLHVVDNQLALLPVGVVGELAISGPVVGRGYLHRPELTNEVFKANPYAQDDLDTRLYLTGDLVKRHENGSLEYMGRKDFQVKVRGFRIELGEIESRLSQHPQVREAVVMARPNAQGEKYLVAYLTYHSTPVTKDALSQHLAAELPEYMVPAVFMGLDAMPLNNNGKVDRKLLPEPELSSMQSEYAAPETDVEIAMAETWQQILQIDKIGRNDNFFDLGGNSIQIIRMLSELKAVGIELRANDIYQHRVLKDCSACVVVAEKTLAVWIEQQTAPVLWAHVNWHSSPIKVLVVADELQEQQAELSRILSAEEPTNLPDYICFDGSPSAAVARLETRGLHALTHWQATNPGAVKKSLSAQLDEFERNLTTAKTEADIPFTPLQQELTQWRTRDHFEWVSVHGYFSTAQLQDAFYQLMVEQDMLRSLLDESNQQWTLVDREGLTANFPVVDLSGMKESEANKLLKQLFTQLRKKQAKSPLPYMGTWIKRSDTLHQLMMMNDHFMSDGVSSAFLQQRLEDLLKGRAQCIGHNYRDYVSQVWGSASDLAYEKISNILALERTSRVVAPTVDALRARSSKKLRSVVIKLPLDTNRNPIDQAFDYFKKWVTSLLNLNDFVMVMNHYGRQLGEESYFDQIGLFLDKIPFAVTHESTMTAFNQQTQVLVESGLSYMALEKKGYDLCKQSFPGLIHEILFNYEGEMSDYDTMHELLADTQAEDKLKQFCGILFEASSLNDQLVVHCAFRGDGKDEKQMFNVLPCEKAALDDLKNATQQRAENTASAATSTKLSNNGVREMRYSIEVNDVKKHYGSFEAVKGVSFNVEKGICFGILGPNGAGKTSLLGMIEGISSITSGSISVLGMDVKSQIKKIQPHIGVQLQQNNYFEFLTVDQLLKFYKDLRSANKRKVNGASVDELLERLNLTDKKKFKVDELSGGQKQRLSIAIALLEDPDILFLDEPTSALDPHSRHEVWDFIEYLKQDKTKTIILTTHYMEEAETLCDELMIMSEGQIVSQGSPVELINKLSPHHDIHLQFGRGQFNTDYLVELSGIIDYQWESQANQLTIKTAKFTETLKDILSISEARSLEILNFNINRPNLEDVFLSSTKKDLVE